MDGSLSGPSPALSTAELAARITELAGHLNAANRRWLAMLAEFDRRKGWSDWLTRSCAHWLNWQCGIDMGAAREKVRVAHALEQLPLLGAAMGRGELSYAKVRALTRVATTATEEVFLSIALHGTAHHVETIARQYRRATEAAELSREARQQAGRALHWHWDDDGSLVLRVRLPAEAGAQLLRAIEVAREDMPRDVSAETHPGEPTPSHAARRADALAVVAESLLAHGAAALDGGKRQQIVVHVDVDTLADRSSGRCELEEGPALAGETARRLACDASVVRIVSDARGEPLDVGRRTRTIPPALRRALQARDRGCRYPGCTHTRFLDGHHVRHWADGGDTKLSNLVSLCRFHHRLVHEGGLVAQRLDDGAWRFVRADGSTLPDPGSHRGRCHCDGTELAAHHRAYGPAIDANTAATRWRGERMDHGQAIMVLMQRAARGSVSAET